MPRVKDHDYYVERWNKHKSGFKQWIADKDYEQRHLVTIGLFAILLILLAVLLFAPTII